MRFTHRWFWAAAFVLLMSLAGIAAAEPAGRLSHPYLLWTREEAAAMKQRIEADASSRRQYEQAAARESIKGRTNPAILNLFKYSVLGDAAAGAIEKKALLAFIGQRPPTNAAGDPNSGNAAWRDDRTLDALRYDVLYDLLTEKERADVEATIAGYVKWLVSLNGGPWAHAGAPRTGWLPNMQWPTVIGVHDLAAASGDEALIKQCFEAGGGWKWYFDEYIAGDRWYMEEFGKYYSNIGAMLIWCEGLERLKLSKYGYGYTGKHGATMERFLQMLPSAGYPRVKPAGSRDDDGATWTYPTVNMGDAAALNLVIGKSADGTGGTPFWGGGRMNGSSPKFMQPLWWELGARRFPEAGFDYFLAQFRNAGEDVYLPTPYFGLKAIDAKSVKAPAAPSVVTSDRGFALLRADESPAYWESPRPAVALQFGMYYVHYVHDCFAILQYVAHNRMIYDKMGRTQDNYAGGDPWRDHVRGQASGVVVDGMKPNPVDGGEDGCAKQRVRSDLKGPMKFVAVRAAGLYPGVTQERALVLTDQYLFDLSALESEKPHVYNWHVLAPASLAGDDAWKAADAGGLEVLHDAVAKKALISDVRTKDVADQAWMTALLQAKPGEAANAQTVGVNVYMLGAAGTTLFVGRPPGLDAAALGTQLVAVRSAPSATFVALHVPFKGDVGGAAVNRFDRIAQDDAVGVAVAIGGRDGLNDRIIVRTGAEVDKPATLAGEGESFEVAGHAYVRITAATVEVFGNVRAMRLKVVGAPKLRVNGKEEAATVADGLMSFGPR